ncbi:MAG: TlpA family protein disulfide reductase [Bacteroidaceae bacterium]|nr:TlpA family protein disulfide reductase [Bacteroidaceae bacterium]
MKTFFTMLIAVLMLSVQPVSAKGKVVVWERPVVTEENTQIDGYFNTLLDIKRVEFASDETRVMMHVANRPDSWIQFASATRLEAAGKQYALKKCDGIELDKHIYLKGRGETDVVFHFEPLPSSATKFDFVEGDAKGAFIIRGVQNFGSVAQQMYPTSWRNEQTGDWEIGFYEDFAIYDCKFWNYKQKQQKGDKYMFVLENDGKEIVVNADKIKDGKRIIAIDGKKATYSLLTSITLPDYPTKDTNPTFKNTHFKTDTVTLVGWLRNRPRAERYDDNSYNVNFTNPITGEDVNVFGKMDSLGRFVVKVPMPNSFEAFFDWDRTFIRTILEPGETYFLFYDFKFGHKFFMGKNCRLQNETLAYQYRWQQYRYKYDMTEDDARKMFDGMKTQNSDIVAELKEIAEKHPTVSDRFFAYRAKSYEAEAAYYNFVAQSFANKYDFVREIVDANLKDLWSKRNENSLMCRAFWKFQEYYVRRMTTFYSKYVVLPSRSQDGEAIYEYLYPQILRRYRDAGKVKITDDELAQLERNAAEWRSTLEADYDKRNEKPNDYMKKSAKILEREDIKKVLDDENSLFDLYIFLEIAESLNIDKDTRDILVSRFLYGSMTDTGEPLNETAARYVDELVSQPSAKAAINTLQNKYLALAKKDVSKYTRSASDIAGMTEGEKILRKIIEPYKGKIILLDVWGTWCMPCRMALEKSKQEYESLKDYDLVYLYLANRSPEDAWKNVIKQYDVTGDNVVHYNLPADQQSAVERFVGVKGYPTYRLIDRNGNLVDVDVDARSIDVLKKVLDKIK